MFTEETCVIRVGTVFDVSSVCGQLNNGPPRRLCQVPSTCEYHLIQQEMGVFTGVVKDAEMRTFSGIIVVRGVLNAVAGVLVRGRQRSCEYRRGRGGQAMLDRGWKDEVRSPGSHGPPGAGRGRGDPPLGSLAGAVPANALILARDD